MTYGIRTVNASGIVNIDEDSISYVYLGKIQMTAGGDYYVHCVGYPLVFFGVPYNTVNSGEGANGNFYDLRTRAGLAMRRLRQVPGDPNTWIISISCNLENLPAMGLYIRVFGKLHLNFPAGSGEHWGARLWNAQGQLTFDTGCRQLRLAGNTYDAELLITSRCPGETGEPANVGDTVVGLPFDLANKSIMANTRGTIRYPYTTSAYHDWETGQDLFYVVVMSIDALFWSSGNALYARKSAIAEYGYEGNSQPNVFLSENNIYTRIAVIDNNLFP
jgi:hypothetical protein